MKRILLEVAYDGTAYHGWQIQPNALTVEGVLNKALSELTGEDVKVAGASRTDAGVHALGNVAVFNSDTKIPAEKIFRALNQRLPKDVIVQSSFEVPMDFHPRYEESMKTYAYQILNHGVNLPTMRKYAYFLYQPLNVEKMRQASEHLIGEHDFTSFCSVGSQVESKVRTIYSIEIDKPDRILTIRIRGNGFLYNMVRIIVGSLILVGEGKWEPDRMRMALDARDREAAGPTAPPHGLTLEKIIYQTLN